MIEAAMTVAVLPLWLASASSFAALVAAWGVALGISRLMGAHR